ncbi:protein of unknown function DUF1776 [Geosmithia morbida]|uniref:DUF1776-domain-containing protein n=1 Tax=Geosmithia morbida TaxID=1094350 RepID=A0A9P5D633_9HYPO|nr:protein of unknown function DUF1776 [Geosmithia morbida]KAF4125206.1 protein of unknown function DUF1776 [Geosmithia morbida]
MSADDQQFLDALGNIPLYLRRYTDDVASFIDQHVDHAAHYVRDTISSQAWIPDSVKPRPPPPPPAAAAASRLQAVQDWIANHKIITGVVVLACGTIAYKGYQHNQSMRKIRRAKRARNGGRTEVVVIAGSASLPLTKSLALDMERRGFVVYIVCNAAEDESTVSSLSRRDIRPLTIDTTDVSLPFPSPPPTLFQKHMLISSHIQQPPSAGAAIERFAHHLQSPQPPAPNVRPNQLTLKSVILIPSLHYQTSPIATIAPSNFADVFNTHLLQPILAIQAFLPLLTSRLQPVGERWVPPKVLVFTPSIISSINPPFHAPEATVCSALSAFTEVLTAELRPLDIPVTHMQLGTFDFSGFVPSNHQARQGIPPSLPTATTAGNPEDTLIWPDGARHVYGRNFVSQTSSAISGGRIRGLRGSSLRHLHNTVFDVMDGSVVANSVRVGLGAGIYGFVGRWVPRSLVSWMMGIRKVDQLSTWKSNVSDSSAGGHSSEDSDDGATAASHEFIAVTPEKNVWRSDIESGSNIWAPSPSRI